MNSSTIFSSSNEVNKGFLNQELKEGLRYTVNLFAKKITNNSNENYIHYDEQTNATLAGYFFTYDNQAEYEKIGLQVENVEKRYSNFDFSRETIKLEEEKKQITISIYNGNFLGIDAYIEYLMKSNREGKTKFSWEIPLLRQIELLIHHAFFDNIKLIFSIDDMKFKSNSLCSVFMDQSLIHQNLDNSFKKSQLSFNRSMVENWLLAYCLIIGGRNLSTLVYKWIHEESNTNKLGEIIHHLSEELNKEERNLIKKMYPFALKLFNLLCDKENQCEIFSKIMDNIIENANYIIPNFNINDIVSVPILKELFKISEGHFLFEYKQEPSNFFGIIQPTLINEEPQYCSLQFQKNAQNSCQRENKSILTSKSHSIAYKRNYSNGLNYSTNQEINIYYKEDISKFKSKILDSLKHSTLLQNSVNDLFMNLDELSNIQNLKFEDKKISKEYLTKISEFIGCKIVDVFNANFQLFIQTLKGCPNDIPKNDFNKTQERQPLLNNHEEGSVKIVDSAKESSLEKNNDVKNSPLVKVNNKNAETFTINSTFTDESLQTNEYSEHSEHSEHSENKNRTTLNIDSESHPEENYCNLGNENLSNRDRVHQMDQTTNKNVEFRIESMNIKEDNIRLLKEKEELLNSINVLVEGYKNESKEMTKSYNIELRKAQERIKIKNQKIEEFIDEFNQIFYHLSKEIIELEKIFMVNADLIQINLKVSQWQKSYWDVQTKLIFLQVKLNDYIRQEIEKDKYIYNNENEVSSKNKKHWKINSFSITNPNEKYNQIGNSTYCSNGSNTKSSNENNQT